MSLVCATYVSFPTDFAQMIPQHTVQYHLPFFVCAVWGLLPLFGISLLLLVFMEASSEGEDVSPALEFVHT